MGLFNKRKKELPEALKPTIAVRDMKFNKTKLASSIDSMAEIIFQSKRNQGHEAFRNLVHKTLNIEILELSEMKPSGEAAEEFAYKRGRIEALRSLLVLEERLIDTRRKRVAAKEETKSSEKASSYLKPKKGQMAGIASV